MTVGEELEHARQRCGLSLQDLSARTKVSIERLQAIERGEVEELPPLVYLRGYVRSYASEVGLDPDHVAERYVAQFEAATALDEFDTEASETPVPPVPAVLDLEPRPAKPEPQQLPPILDLSPRPAEAGRGVGGGPRLAEPAGPDLSAGAPAAASSNDPADSELSPGIGSVPAAEAAPVPSIAGRPWRPAQFRRESPGTVALAERLRPPIGAVHQPAGPALHGGKLAVGVAAAVLAGFVLSAQVDEFRSDRTPDADAVPSDRAAGPSAASPEAAPPAASTATEPSAGQHVAGREPVRADARAEPAEVSRAGAELPDPLLSGTWSLVNRIDGSNYPAFANLTLEYRLQLQQQGDRVTGRGQKWSENGRAIAPRSRTPIDLEGTLDGRRLELRFTEQGRRRATAGTLVMQVSEDGSMRGRFVSEAAQSRGTSRATRLR